MGLDITAYKGLIKVENPELDESGCPENWEAEITFSTEYTERGFPGRTAGLPDEKEVYAFEDKCGFRAGSYSGYNNWRNQLAKLAGYKCDKDCWNNHTSGPFYELINFFDNEGIIGPIVAAKLAMDFSEFKAKAEAVEDEYLFEKYCEWRNAFIMASDNGVVVFH